MATKEPSKPALSVEDAELFASRIRPSWELVDDSLRAEIAADLASAAGAPGSAPDTLIQGVPTLSIGDDPAPAAPARVDPAASPLAAAVDAAARAATVNGSNGAARANGSAQPAAAAGAPRKSGVSATLIDEVAQPVVAPRPAPAQLRPSKTQIGIGSEDAKPAATPAKPAEAKPAEQAPSSRRAVRAAAAQPAGKTLPDDDIQIPITGAPKGLVVKVALGVAVAIGLAVVGYGVLGGGKDEGTAPSATAAATAAPTQAAAAKPSATAAATPPAATAAPSAATAAPSAPSASAAPSVAKEPEPKKAAKEPEPKKQPEPKKTEPKKAAPPPPKKAAPPPPPPKKGGGIIRESPF